MITAAETQQRARMSEELVWEISDCLESFAGEETLKEIFWSLLSFDRRRESLSFRHLRPEYNEAIESLELFASHDGIGVVRTQVSTSLSHLQMEQFCKGLAPRFTMLLLLLHQTDTDSWMLIYPDQESHYIRLRPLAIPGAPHEVNVTARALAALAAFDWDSEESSQRLEMMQRMDVFFPGATLRGRWEFDPTLSGREYHFYKRVKKALPLEDFYNEIKDYPLLTPAQEWGEDLSEIPEKTEKLNEYEQRLVKSNIRLVIYLALKYSTNVLSIEDIVQEGILGLINAASKFDPKRGLRFSTYAWTSIKRKILRAIQLNQNLIRWPCHRYSELVSANRSDDQPHLDLGEREALLVSNGELDRVSEQMSQQDIVELKQLQETIQLTLKRFVEREARVLCRRHGLDGKPEATLEEVGEEEKVTRERIRQIQVRAEKKLKRILPEWIKREYGMESEENEAEETTEEEIEDLESTTC